MGGGDARDGALVAPGRRPAKSHWVLGLQIYHNVRARAGEAVIKTRGLSLDPEALCARPRSKRLPRTGPHRAWSPPAPPARPPARRSPSSSRWMMLSMLSLSISAIAVLPPTLPQRRRRRLAPGPHTSSFLTPRAPRAVVAAAVAAAAAAGPPPSRPAPGFLLLSPLEPREEQNGRRLVRPASGGARMRARECSGRAGTSLQAHRARGRGRGRLREGAGPSRFRGRGPGRDG